MATSGTGKQVLAAVRPKDLLVAPFCRADWEAVASPHLHLRIGNAPPCTDRDAALDALGAFLGRINGFGCQYCELWQQREAVYTETDVRFMDEVGRLRVLPCAIVARVKAGLVQDMRFHLAPSPIP